MKLHLKYFDPSDITTFVNKGTGKHIISDGFTTIPVYKGKQYSIKDVVNSDGTINVRKAKKIMEEVAEYFGGKKMQNRPENPVWHKDDPNTWLHTKKVAKNAWAIPVPEGYTKQDQMVAALGHDFGKILSGDGHAEVSYNLIKQIFPDATEKQLNAIRKHMNPIQEIVKEVKKLGDKDQQYFADQLTTATKFADIGVIAGADLTQLGVTPEELEIVKQTKWFKEGGNLIPKAAGGKKLLEDIFHKIFPGKTLKDLTPEEWDIAYDYVLKKYNNNPSNILQKIRDYHFYTAAPDTIVKEASGKPLQVFHGGTSPNIREFSLDTPNNASLTNTLDKRIYFSDKKGIASQYAVDPEYKLALTIDHLADAVGLDKEGLEIIASRLEMPVEDVKKIIEDYKIGLDFVRRKTNEEDFIYPAYLNIRKHADVDLDGDIIARLSKEQRAKINAEPGAIIRNVDESVSNQYGIKVAPSTDYLVQYPQQIKRSAAITYDTNGNIIPISKRDNFHNPDINFKNGGNIEYFSKNSIIKAESGIKAILNAAKSASRKTTKKVSQEASQLSLIDDLFPEEVALRNIEKEKQIKLLEEFRNFKSKLDWSDDGWLSMRKHMDKYDPSLGPGESYGKPFDEITNPKGYTQQDKKIFRAYKNQLKEIEFIAKKEGTWLDGGKFKDDPRLWVMMQLEKRKHGENVLELFSGMTQDQASNFAKYTGEVWGTEGVDKYFGDHYWPYRTNIDGFDTHDAYNQVYNTLSVPGIPGQISTDGLLKRANKGIIVKNVNENWSAVGDTSFNAPEHIVNDYAQHAGTPRWFLYGNTGNFNMGFNKYGGHLIKKHQFGKILEKINPVEIFKQRAMSKGIKKSALDEIKKFNLKSEKGRQAAAEYIVSLDKLSGKQAEDAIEQYKAFFKDASTKMEKGASVDGAPIIHSEPRETEFKTQIQDAHEMFHNLIPKCETPIPEEAIDPIDLLDLHPKAKDPIYFLNDNNNEVAARISQVLSAHGVTDARHITGKELKQMFESYLDSPNVINDQVDFIKNAVKNWDVLAKWVNNPRNVLLAPVAVGTAASFATLTEAPKQTPYNKNGGTLNKFQEGGTLSKWSIEQELPIFRHLKNSQLAQNIDQDLNEFFAKGEIQYGQLSKDARKELQRKYNLDQRQVKETLDDLFNAGLGKALIADLITANTNLAAFKSGGVIQKCSIGSAIKKFAGEGLAGIEQKIIKETGENVVLQATGNTKVIGKATTEHLRKVAKATNDQRIKVLADFAEQCRDKGIKLPEEFNQFVDSIFKTPVATKTDKKIIRVGKEVTADPEIITHNGVSIERPTFDKIKYKTKTVHTGEFKDKLEFKRTIPKTQEELQELSPKIDEAINSLRSMMEGDSFKLTPTMMDEIYSKSKGRVQNFKGNKEQTKALRKLFGEIEYPTLVKRQLDSSYIYPQAPSEELARFYNANAENIEWFKKIRDLVQNYVNDPNYLGPVGKVQVTPLKIIPRKQQVAVYHRDGDYISFLPKQIMTKQDAPYIKAYRLTIDGKPIKGTPTFNFEEHHSTPLALMQAEAYLANPSPKNTMEHVLTYQNQRKVNGSKDAYYNKFLVLDKSEHTGVNGIHYNDKWSLQDLQRIKALARSGRFKTMDDLLYYYDRLKAQQLSYLPKANSGTKLIPKNYFRKMLQFNIS